MPHHHRIRARRRVRTGRIIALVNRAYRHTTRIFALVMCGLGVAMIVSALARGGGALALGVVLGVAFVALGVGRLYLAGER